MTGSKNQPGGDAVDAVRTRQEAESETAKREAEQNAAAATGSGDSPKPHGDKLDHATQEAAKG